MYRKCIEQLRSWAESTDRGVMVLRGARQVGKTTLIRILAKLLGLTLVEINLEDKPSFVVMLDKRANAKDILELILLEKGVNASPEKILIFFDEIQEIPGFYAYLRYFKELASEYRVIAAGSLLEFETKKANAPQGPAGRVEFAYLEPMSFEEFLLAANPVAHKQLLKLPLDTAVNENLHEIYYKLFKQYMVCGGMPAAVRAFVNDEGPLRIDEIKNNLLTGYINDLAKYSELSGNRYDTELLELLLRKVTGDPTNAMTLSKLAPGYKAEKIRKHIDILVQAKVMRKSIHSHQNKPPLLNGSDDKAHKLFALDVGLCYSYMDLLPQEVYSKGDMNSLAEGALAEQYVAQTLQSIPPHYKVKNLYHWERKKKSATSEVDFLTTLDSLVIPIECKSGHSNKMESLKILMGSKPYQFALRLYAGNIDYCVINAKKEDGSMIEEKLLSLPHYLLERFTENIASIRDTFS